MMKNELALVEAVYHNPLLKKADYEEIARAAFKKIMKNNMAGSLVGYTNETQRPFLFK